MADRNSNRRSGGTVAVIGGGALLLWLLLRGKGRGWGGGDGGTGNAASAGTGAFAEAPFPTRPACQVFVRAHRIDLNGVPADLPTVVASCRASGQAVVRASGGASVQAVENVVVALQTANVTVAGSENVSAIVQRMAARKR